MDLRQPLRPASARHPGILGAGFCMVLLGVLAPACGPAPPGAHTLELEFVRPVNRDGVYLNEQLIFYFNRPVEQASVTGDSVRVEDGNGIAARGRLVVRGKEVRFVPAAILSPDLSGGGYRPATSYVVRLGGFPRVNCLRSVGGEPLSSSLSWAFRTVAVGGLREGFVFADGTPEEGSPLRLVSSTLTPDEPLRMTCAEPLDPSTLRDGDMILVEHSGQGDGRVIPLRGHLVKNAADGRGSVHSPAAVLDLYASERLKPGEYWLPLPRKGGLRDYGGNPVWLPRAPGSMRGQAITVVEAGEDRGRGELWLPLLETRLRSPVALPGADGTARWDGDGRIRIRFPAAAGDGRDGALTLKGIEERRDLHATALYVPAGSACELGPAPGFRVLRAQGSVVIDGTLSRIRAGAGPSPPMDFGPDETLSAWIRRAATRDVSWTVLVAGGDLFIRGRVLVDTPLLLVAGGTIRVSGDARAQSRQLWLLRDGGGLRLDPTASVAPLRMDAPDRNPLVKPLVYAVSSALVPPWGRVERWLSGQADGRAGQGAWSVRYGQPTASGMGWVDHPRALAGEGGLHLRFDLEVQPARGQAWDPPEVDYVHLRWATGSAPDGREGPGGGEGGR